MPRYNRRDRKDLDVAVVDMQIRPAESGLFDLDLDLAGARLRLGDITDLHIAGAVFILHKCFHVFLLLLSAYGSIYPRR